MKPKISASIDIENRLAKRTDSIREMLKGKGHFDVDHLLKLAAIYSLENDLKDSLLKAALKSRDELVKGLDEVGPLIEKAEVKSAGMMAKAEEMGRAEAITARARNGALGKQANDKHKDHKEIIRTCWEKWQSDRSLYKNQAAWVAAMIGKELHYRNAEVLKRWDRQWTKQMAK